MSLYIVSINSGSNGNCYYVGNGHEAVLVDAGLSLRETEKRMRRLDLSMEQVKAIFISHEHGDHIRGVEGITSRYKIPVYITTATLISGRLRIPAELVRPFTAHEPVHIGGLAVSAFPKEHDAADAHSFLVSGNGINIGVYTDLGVPCERLVHSFRQCHAAFLEANYDEHMLETGGYPIHLKNRIRGGKGHLSNRQAMELLATHRPAHMTHLLLAHLSQNNNSPELVHGLFNEYADELNIIIASRDRESALYEITGMHQVKAEPYYAPAPRMVQAALF